MEKVYSERVLNITTQPIHANFLLWAGGELLTTEPSRPNIFQEFEFTKLDTAGSTATFTLFDDNWESLEAKLSLLYDKIQIQYGYPGITRRVSPIYNMILQEYSISFVSTGVLLSIQAMSEGAYQNIQPISTDPLGTTNPTEAIKEVCRKAGWKVEDSNFDATQDIELPEGESFSLQEDNPVSYITTVLVPAASKNGKNYIFYFDENNVPYFREIQYNNNSEAVATYVYQKGYDSGVLDLTFDIKGVFGGTSNFQTVTGFKAELIDPLTKEITKIQENLNTTRDQVTGPYSHTNSSQSTVVYPTAGLSRDLAHSQLYYKLKNASDSIYEATMTILGDPTLKILDTIRIINVTDSGNLHHTSGLYMIKGITDTISGGSMTTSLKLIRNGSLDDGVELMNYRKLLK